MQTNSRQCCYKHFKCRNQNDRLSRSILRRWNAGIAFHFICRICKYTRIHAFYLSSFYIPLAAFFLSSIWKKCFVVYFFLKLVCFCLCILCVCFCFDQYVRFVENSPLRTVTGGETKRKWASRECTRIFSQFVLWQKCIQNFEIDDFDIFP